MEQTTADLETRDKQTSTVPTSTGFETTTQGKGYSVTSMRMSMFTSYASIANIYLIFTVAINRWGQISLSSVSLIHC